VPIYRSGSGPTACVRCNAHIDPKEAILTGDGPICDLCHKEEKRDAKAAAHARTAGADVLLYGLLAIAGGLAMLVLALVLPDGPVVTGVLKVASGGAAISIGACIQTLRLRVGSARARLGRVLGMVGAAAALFGLFVFLVRLL
jgi:hypothetical protein